MQLKIRKPWRLPMRIASAAIVVLCAAGVAAVLGWTPSSMGGAPKPNQLTAPLQPGDPNAQALPLQAPNGNTRATRCGDCGVVESMREIADPSERGSATRCEPGGNPVTGTAGGGETENVPIETLVAWHVYARTGMGCVDELTLAPSSRHSSTLHYEVVVVFRDGSRRAFKEVVNESRVPTWRLGDRVKVMTEVI